MKNFLLLVVSLTLVGFLFAGTFLAEQPYQPTQSRPTREFEDWHVQGFADIVLNDPSTPGVWETLDAAVPYMWHLSNIPYVNPPGSTYSWWMGETAYASGPYPGGYGNARVVYLDTPPITLPAGSPTMTFDVNWCFEPCVEGAGTTIDGIWYDGWDGAVVRISTNGGSTWSNLIPTAPAYNFINGYGWGYNGLIPNNQPSSYIPGWGDTSDGWQEATFDLSAYAGQTVIIRWMFGSDPAACTASQGHPSWFGVAFDNLNIADVFVHDFDDNNYHGMTYGALTADGGGDLWHISNYNNPIIPPNVLRNQDTATQTFNVLMDNYVTSDWYTLPTNSNIRVDFQVRGNWAPPSGSTGEGTGFTFALSLNGEDWWGINEPWPGGTWYYYSTSSGIPDWTWFTESWSASGEISMYAGETVQFRWGFQSGPEVAAGREGFMVDNFVIQIEKNNPNPRDLVATTVGNTVELQWVNPVAPGPVVEGWISHGNDTFADGIGRQDDEEGFMVAHRFSAMQLIEMGAVNGYLTKMAFIPYHSPQLPNLPKADYTMKVWTNGMGLNVPGDLVYESPTPLLGNDLVPFHQQWYEVVFPNPILIEYDTELRIGYGISRGDGYAATVVSNPQVQFYGNLITSSSGSWGTLSLPYNWAIKGYVVDQDGQPLATLGSFSPEALIENDYIPPVEGLVTLNGPTRNLPIVDEFFVYRKPNLQGADSFGRISIVDGDLTTYVDAAPAIGVIAQYYVTAMYGEDESAPTNIASAFITSPDQVLYMHDDGTAETHQTGVRVLVNRFDPGPNATRVTHLYYYVQQQSTSMAIQIQMFPENANGMPGERSYLQTVTHAQGQWQPGWNILELNPTGAEVNGAPFFIGILLQAGTATSLGIGVDTDTNPAGKSFIRSSNIGVWSQYETGVFMIRAIVEGGVGEYDIVDPVEKLTARNYPNPFNPTTQIHFQNPKQGIVNVSIYNIKGQLVQTLLNEERPAGENSIIWNGKDSLGRDTASGVYFYKVSTDTDTVINKMVLMK